MNNLMMFAKNFDGIYPEPAGLDEDGQEYWTGKQLYSLILPDLNIKEKKLKCIAIIETIQAVKFAPSGFWTGFTAMIRHGFSQHQMSKGSIFRFEFDFDNSKVRLLVN